MKKIIFYIILSNFMIENIFANTYQILQSRLNKIKNFHAYFIHKVVNSEGILIQQGKGEVWLKYPNKFNFLFILPDTMNIVSDGKILWIYNPIINQVNISNLQDTINTNPLIFIINNKLVKDLVFFKITKKENNFLIIPIKNNSKNINFKKISINISKKGIINNFIIIDFNYKNSYYFNRQNTKKTINKNKFIFSIPKESIIDDQRS